MRRLLRRILGSWLLVEVGRALITGVNKQRQRRRERQMPMAPEL